MRDSVVVQKWTYEPGERLEVIWVGPKLSFSDM
jgi:hypothetical protein